MDTTSKCTCDDVSDDGTVCPCIPCGCAESDRIGAATMPDRATPEDAIEAAALRGLSACASLHNISLVDKRDRRAIAVGALAALDNVMRDLRLAISVL